jgi:hypothetical protein
LRSGERVPQKATPTLTRAENSKTLLFPKKKHKNRPLFCCFC